MSSRVLVLFWLKTRERLKSFGWYILKGSGPLNCFRFTSGMEAYVPVCSRHIVVECAPERLGRETNSLDTTFVKVWIWCGPEGMYRSWGRRQYIIDYDYQTPWHAEW